MGYLSGWRLGVGFWVARASGLLLVFVLHARARVLCAILLFVFIARGGLLALWYSCCMRERGFHVGFTFYFH
jgi:hypothetical protein